MAVRSKKDNPSPFTVDVVEPLILDVPEEAETLTFIAKDEPQEEVTLTFIAKDEPQEEVMLEVPVEVKKQTPLVGIDLAGGASNVKVAQGLTDVESMIMEVDHGVEFLTILAYGKNGTGKTTLLSTADGILIAAAEDGTLSLRNKLDPKRGRKIQIDTWATFESLYFLLKNGINSKNEIWINTKTGKFQVKYLAIDTLTKLFEICIRSLVLDTRMKGKTGEIDLITKTLKDWGDATERMKYWLNLFEELPCQRIWLCQETTNSEDVEADEYSIYPSLSKSLRSYVMSEADIIARTYISKGDKGEVNYRLTAVPSAKFVTKDRTSAINSGAITSPDLTKIYNHIFKEVK